MAPIIGIAVSNPPAKKLGFGFRQAAAVPAMEMEELRRRNFELETELAESKEREEELGRELERTKGQLQAVEAAEERLCTQLGELEAEAIAQAREYNRRIRALSNSLAEAQTVIGAGGGRLKANGSA